MLLSKTFNLGFNLTYTPFKMTFNDFVKETTSKYLELKISVWYLPKECHKNMLEHLNMFLEGLLSINVDNDVLLEDYLNSAPVIERAVIKWTINDFDLNVY